MTASTKVRVAGYVHVVVAVLCAGLVIGALFGPSISQADDDPAPIGEGVVAAEEGYRFVPTTSELGRRGGAFAFQIQDQLGEPVTEYEELHERPLHLIVVSRDLAEFHHVHPTLDTTGTWTVELPPLPPGSYRAITDFWITGGPRLALGVDLYVAGAHQPTEPATPTDVSHVDGYEVTLAATTGATGEMTATLTVRHDGDVVEPDPYLGANGHLVALRAGDLAYAHVHPDEDEDEHDTDTDSEGEVRFEANLDSAGRYGLFFDFRHGGAVHTATFTFDQRAVTDPIEMEMS
jgi:hypothetical protein